MSVSSEGVVHQEDTWFWEEGVKGGKGRGEGRRGEGGRERQEGKDINSQV